MKRLRKLWNRITRPATLASRVARLEAQVFSRPHVDPEFQRAAPAPPDAPFDYVGFEQKFRGPSELIQENLRFYIDYVRGVRSVVDLGCGRGEFLQVLRDAGMSARGVESEPGQVALARAKGLDVVQADLFDYLRSLPDGSQDVLFSAQVIEHLPFRELDRLFKLCFVKLRPGGLMIAETVNPHCTAAFKFFYLDPSHQAPLFPEVTQFLAESAGFGKVEIAYPAPGLSPERAYHECGEYAVVARR
jgi:O-antigen chain-terminating methyltransferase